MVYEVAQGDQRPAFPMMRALVAPSRDSSADAPAARITRAPRATVAPVSFDVARTPAAVRALEAEWMELFERSGAPAQVFQHYHWIHHCLATYVDRCHEPAVLTARDGAGRLILVWPMKREICGSVRTLSWLSEPVGQYGDAIVDEGWRDPAFLAAAWRHLVQTVRADAVYMRRVRADAVVMPTLDAMAFRVIAEDEAPFVDFGAVGAFDAFVATRLPARARKDRRRKLRRLAERGPLVFETVEDRSEAARVAEIAIRMKRAWLAAKNLASHTLADDRVLRFFSAIAADADRNAGCRVAVARSAGELAAVQISFTCKDHVAMHVIVYNVELQRYGVGTAHLDQTVEDLHASGVARLDFLAPKQPYKMEYATGAVTVRDYVQPLTVRGRVYTDVYAAHVRPTLKSLVPHLPAPIRRFAGA